MLIRHYHAAIESDLLDKHLDLLDMYRGGLSIRRVKIVIDNLGPGSALHRAMAGSPWTVTDYLLADLIDIEQLALWQRGNEGAKKPSEKPSPYPRPGVPGELSKEEQRVAQMRAWRDNNQREGTG